MIVPSRAFRRLRDRPTLRAARARDFAGPPAEAVAILGRVANVVVPAKTLLELLASHGWRHETAHFTTAMRDLPGTRIQLAKRAPRPEQKVSRLLVAGSPDLASVERIPLSELVRTARALAG